jgi:hypothetical protein
LALYDTPVYSNEYLDILLPSTLDADATYGCVTVISFKLSYSENAFNLFLHKTLASKDDEDEEEENDEDENDDVNTSSEDASILESQDIPPEEELTVPLYTFTTDNIDQNTWVTELGKIRDEVNQVTDLIGKSDKYKLKECKYFEIQAPFPLLKKHKMSILDVCTYY